MPRAFDLVAAKLEHAKQEHMRSLDWYIFIVEPLMERTRLPIDGDYASRRWWFVLRPCFDAVAPATAKE